VTFAQRLQSARARLGLSQAKAARAISRHLSYRTLQDWELGRSEPAKWVQGIILARLARPQKKNLKKE